MLGFRHSLLTGLDPARAIATSAAFTRAPRVTGDELFAAYRNHQGPGNIPPREMWQYHTELSDRLFELDRLVQEQEDADVALSGKAI